MKMRCWFLIGIMVLLMVSSAFAEVFNTDITVSLSNGTVKVIYEGGERILDLTTTGDIVIPVTLNRTLNNTFDYSRLENMMLNYEQIKQMCSEEIDQTMADQQSWLSVTFLKSKDEYDALTNQNEICNKRVQDLLLTVDEQDRMVMFMNTSQSEKGQILERENKTYSFTISALIILIAVFLIYLMYLNAKSSQRFRWGK